jgi:hypothetical protein
MNRLLDTFAPRDPDSRGLRRSVMIGAGFASLVSLVSLVSTLYESEAEFVHRIRSLDAK